MTGGGRRRRARRRGGRVAESSTRSARSGSTSELARDEAGRAPRRGRLDRLRAGRSARTTTRGPRWRRRGTLTIDGDGARRSTGTAWFDHQWGDFIAVGGGGWDWFAVNLDDGTDLTLSLVRDADGSYPLVYGTLVDADGPDAPPAARRVHGRGHRPLDEPGDRRRLPGRLAHHDPRRGPRDRPRPDGRRPGARHAGDDRRRLLGGIAGRRGDARRASRSAARATSS